MGAYRVYKRLPPSERRKRPRGPGGTVGCPGQNAGGGDIHMYIDVYVHMYIYIYNIVMYIYIYTYHSNTIAIAIAIAIAIVYI